MPAKTRKAITKRFKITKTGKVLRRQSGLNHFRSKKTGQYKRKKRRLVEVSKPESKVIKKLLKY